MTKGVFVQTKHCCKAFLEHRCSDHHMTFESTRHRSVSCPSKVAHTEILTAQLSPGSMRKFQREGP